MFKLDPPIFSGAEVFAQCVRQLRSPTERIALSAISSSIQNMEDDYRNHAKTGAVENITGGARILDEPTRVRIGLLYAGQLLRKNTDARVYYDRILSVVPNARCGFCRLRTAWTIDHYLPKEAFPEIAVLPINLVPCCRDCNSLKHAFRPVDEERIIHPYYDDLDIGSIVEARLRQQPPLSIRFGVSSNNSHMKARTVAFHMRKLDLYREFSVHWQNDARSLQRALLNRFGTGGRKAVEHFLDELIAGVENVPELIWKEIGYKAARVDQEFCDMNLW